MKILKVALIVVVIIIALFVVVGLFLPATVHVERSTVVEAAPHTVFALVDSTGAFNSWSPWHGRDPNTKYTYEGPDYGVGATMSWKSEHRDVGSGTQTITVSEPFSRVETSLDFGPQGTAVGFYDLEPIEQGTKVTWGFDTDFGFDLLGRYFGFFLFDSMLGADFEQGLANLKRVAEELPGVDWTGLDLEVIEVEPVTIAYVSSQSSQEPDDIGQALADAYAKVMTFVQSNGLTQAGAPLSITTTWDDSGYVFDAGVPIEGEAEASDEVKVGPTYGGKVVKVVHTGPYVELPTTWEAALAFVKARGYEEAGRPWEAYVSDPTQVPEEELKTHLFIPVS